MLNQLRDNSRLYRHGLQLPIFFAALRRAPVRTAL